MNTVKQWYVKNQDEITWFLIGWLSMSCLDNLIRGSYGWAVFDAAVVYVNYKLRTVRAS